MTELNIGDHITDDYDNVINENGKQYIRYIYIKKINLETKAIFLKDFNFYMCFYSQLSDNLNKYYIKNIGIDLNYDFNNEIILKGISYDELEENLNKIGYFITKRQLHKEKMEEILVYDDKNIYTYKINYENDINKMKKLLEILTKFIEK